MEFSIAYPPELPVSRMRDEIADAIRDNQVVIVAGATGSGKTTQLPKICLELGRESIGHTQPRRLAARTISERIAEELGGEVGQLVGYQVRFTDKVSADTRIKLMTDGILLNELQRDRLLKKYDTIIIDEAHERSLNIDFLLGYLKQLLPRRPDLKLIITSATIDPQSFSKHFGDAPIVEVSGRTYPVEIRYRPLVAEAAVAGEDDDLADAPMERPADDRDFLEGINAALDELAAESSGDVLVFLSGENEIRDAEDAIRSRNLPHTEVLPLYGRLSSADQHRVFQPSTQAGVRRRIVLATNVAETSLTVPGIKYVIDAGTARISRYSVRSKVQRLPIEAISQASANQRSGRSGRTSDGIAIRLYSEEDFARRPEFTEPEILRTNLAAVILQMVSLGLGDIAAFPFLQPPDSRGIKDGVDLLTELGAVVRSPDGTPALTKVGRDLSRLPIDPRFARMVVESRKHGVSREVMIIVAGLTIQDVRERPLEKRPQADQQHARFVDPASDFITLLNLWNHLEEKEAELSSSAFRRMCKAEFLNYVRVREWKDVFRQLRQLARPLDLQMNQPKADPDGIHRSLLAGLLSHIGLKDAQKKDYVGARQSRFVVFPGSALAKKQPDAIMSAELVETSRLFARTNAAIDPAWAEPIAGGLVKRTHSEPHWEKKQGATVAWERVTLYGVPIVLKRRVQFSRIDPAYARELFIRHALVEGDWESQQAFDRANRKLREELAEVEERTRRRDILNDDEAVFDFYDKRIPRDVASTRAFEGWWKKQRQETPELLTMTAEELLAEDAVDVDEAAFPPTWQQGDQRLSLTYRFEPGAPDDGVTVQVPLALLARLSPAGFDWQVPGMRRDLVTAMIKALPKALRKNVVPAADWADRLLEGLPEPDPQHPVAFTTTIAGLIMRKAHVRVADDDFDLDRIPAHLRMAFRVVDERGREVAAGRDLTELQARLSSRARDSVARATARPVERVAGASGSATRGMERTGLTTWDLDELPRFVDTAQGGTGDSRHVIRAYPALVDEGSTVAIRLMATAEDQARAMPGGVRRLLVLAIANPSAYVKQHLTSQEKLMLATSPYPNVQALFDDCLLAAIDQVLERVAPGGAIYSKELFETARDRVSGVVMDSMFDTVALVNRILTGARDAERAIKQATSMQLIGALTDAREQLAGLVHPGFVSATGLARLQRLPAYLSGLTHRVQRLPDQPARDRAWMTEVQKATDLYREAGGVIPSAPHAPESLVHARWMLEELRLSLFAQHLPTAEPVSLQRIRKVLAG
ncbi:ATP-dependent RNA helicase HrpA [Clavibacter michiganensis]|uniref:ATP-dependent RNA helicase HrpA n=1 Tax=Clavibacter michiganensis TaxID=28447 RepID=UPI000CE7D602|nr:ATP-dependent RNA helicase HrpA [Clavibacter michiganensis]PPF86801.1 ATP-dependent RNA helicase HrpA [Clavibacter michiganensis]PPF93525.1 ATP-dependent RNA helicase HrpA [Clavibacter michiganensis]